MSIVAHTHPFFAGVDTHVRNRPMSWVARRAEADADTLWLIEGAASCGTILTSTVASYGYLVAEAPRMDAKKRSGVGKSDILDAHRIAAAALPVLVDQIRQPRLNDGVRQAIQTLVTAGQSMTKDRTRSINVLTAVLRRNDLSMDASKALNKTQITEVSK